MTWKLVSNPNYAGIKPQIIEVICHDRTPFLTVGCDCGSLMHVHESQIAGIRSAIATHCKGCEIPMLFPPLWFADAFQKLRDDGWIE
jgi:hypothetical protein